MMIRGRIAIAATALMVACGGGDAADDATQTPAAEPETPATAPATSSIELPEGVTPEMVAQGQQLFNTGICMTCHGMNGTGSPLGPPMTDQEWLNIDGSYDAIVEVINTGVLQPKQFTASAMPPLGGGQFTEEQVRHLAAYVYSLSRGG